MKPLSSLTNRIFAGTAALVVLAIGVAVSRVTLSVTSRAETELQRGLSDAVTLVDEFSRTQFTRFERDARLIASLPVLRGAMATGDGPTVQPIADDYQTLLNGDVFVVTDASGRVLAGSGRFGRDNDTITRVLAERPPGDAGTWFWSYPGGVLLVTAVPMETLGTLVVGASFDQAVVDRLQGLTRSDIALVTGDQVIVSSLPGTHGTALEQAREEWASGEVHLAGEEYAVRELRLAAAGVGGTDLVAMVLRSRTEQTAFLAALRRQIVLAGVVAVFVATLLGYGIARTVTRPLRAVTATMREMAATGDLGSNVPPPGPWDDEDARLLSTTFRQMTASLDRFQRDAAQRERLSSLGRLSAVVAHEVRNPLMIIKTAVRSLRRSTSPADVDTAATSIEEEVARLNCVVSDVLDFARPVRFAIAPVDVAIVCHEAAAAASSGQDDAAVSVEIDPALAGVRLSTDADRLRSVLVNVLANAQEAMRERGDDAARPPVQLRAWRTADAGVRISVVDAGPGIAPADQARVFEPFFTTRRSGSGLGLAITRNIVEGLGGTVQVRSQLGQGTTVEIVLPADPPPDGRGSVSTGAMKG